MASAQNTEAIKYETLRSIAASTFTGSYQSVGTPLVNPARKIKFKNLTNQVVTLSTDGVNAMDVFQLNSGDSEDFTANRNTRSGAFFPAGTQFYVTASAGTGTFYIVVQYT